MAQNNTIPFPVSESASVPQHARRELYVQVQVWVLASLALIFLAVGLWIGAYFPFKDPRMIEVSRLQPIGQQCGPTLVMNESKIRTGCQPVFALRPKGEQ